MGDSFPFPNNHQPVGMLESRRNLQEKGLGSSHAGGARGPDTIGHPPTMRIALISNMFPPDSDGGLEVNALKIANGLRSRGHQVEVLTSRYRPGFAPAEVAPAWVHRILTLAPPWSSEWTGLAGKPKLLRALIGEVLGLRSNVRATERWLAGRDFDVAYCFGMSLIGPATTLPFTRRGVPAFFHQGGGYLEARYVRAAKESVFLRLRRSLLAMENKVDLRYLGYVSQYLIAQGEASGFFDEPNRGTRVREVIPRGIDFKLCEDVQRPRTEPPTFLMAGRILPIKGFHLAIDAAARLHHRRPERPWRLTVVGEPDNQDVETESGDSYMRRLEGQIADAGVGARIVFVGRKPRAELLALLRDATAFISASICGEGFANTIIETLGSGTPLVVSNDGSALEVVVPGRSALVYEKEDVETLSRHMEWILDNPEGGMELAREGLAVIRERYTLDKVLDKTEQVLEQVVQIHRDQGILDSHE